MSKKNVNNDRQFPLASKIKQQQNKMKIYTIEALLIACMKGEKEEDFGN